LPGAGGFTLLGSDIRGFAGLTAYLQMTVLDPAAIQGISMSNGLTLQVLP
jgi:hypothetical protein